MLGDISCSYLTFTLYLFSQAFHGKHAVDNQLHILIQEGIGIKKKYKEKRTKPPYQLIQSEDACLLVSPRAGTGTFGRVRLVRHMINGDYYALKISKKSSIIRMKQVTFRCGLVEFLFFLGYRY